MEKFKIGDWVDLNDSGKKELKLAANNWPNKIAKISNEFNKDTIRLAFDINGKALVVNGEWFKKVKPLWENKNSIMFPSDDPLVHNTPQSKFEITDKDIEDANKIYDEGINFTALRDVELKKEKRKNNAVAIAFIIMAAVAVVLTCFNIYSGATQW